MLCHTCDRPFFKQIGVIFEGAAQTFRAFAHHQGQVKGGGAAVQLQRLNLQARRFEPPTGAFCKTNMT